MRKPRPKYQSHSPYKGSDVTPGGQYRRRERKTTSIIPMYKGGRLRDAIATKVKGY